MEGAEGVEAAVGGDVVLAAGEDEVLDLSVESDEPREEEVPGLGLEYRSEYHPPPFRMKLDPLTKRFAVF